jgi:iron(III) transport system ATP-binding protein
VAATTTPPLPDAVACAGLSVGYGCPALAGLDLAVAPGETLALLGSSGSGKTTLLNAIAGFVAPLAGQIWLAGQLASGPGRLVPPERRRIGMVFQDYALWPHLSVVDTVAYPLRRAGASKTAAHRGARDILEQMSLGPLAERRPGQLSGGEQQRVGLARALAGAPALYLFDEPTAHLDATLRAQILDEVARRRAADGAAAVYATHDATEALAIADRVAVLHSGCLAQLAPPADVYAAPADLTIARLTGPVSVLTAPLTPVGPHHYTLHLPTTQTTVPATTAPHIGPAASPTTPANPTDPITTTADTTDPAILVRPDWARLADPADHADPADLPGTITEVRFRGPHTDYHLTTPAGPLLIREPGPPRAAPGPVRWSLLRVRLMPRRA